MLQLTLAIILIIVAIFLFFKISPKDFLVLLEVSENTRKKTLKTQIKKKDNKIVNSIRNLQNMLTLTGQQGNFNFIIILSFALIVFGVNIAISIGNYFLIPVLAISLGIIPIIYIKLQFIEFQKMQVAEISEAMKMITGSYLRTENILSAIEENLDGINEPAYTVFSSFIIEMKSINPNYDSAIDNMKSKISHSIWIEWCEALKRCSHNRTLKYVLSPIVAKFTKVKIVTNEIQALLNNAIKNFWMLFFATLVLLYMGIYMLPQALMVEIPVELANFLVTVNIAIDVFAGVKVLFETRKMNFDL